MSGQQGAEGLLGGPNPGWEMAGGVRALKGQPGPGKHHQGQVTLLIAGFVVKPLWPHQPGPQAAHLSNGQEVAGDRAAPDASKASLCFFATLTRGEGGSCPCYHVICPQVPFCVLVCPR